MFVDPVIAFTLNPSMATAGVLCVLIPVIIHLLFRRRRKPIQWATMRFIIDAWRKTMNSGFVSRSATCSDQMRQHSTPPWSRPG